MSSSSKPEEKKKPQKQQHLQVDRSSTLVYDIILWILARTDTLGCCGLICVIQLCWTYSSARFEREEVTESHDEELSSLWLPLMLIRCYLQTVY